MSGGAVGPDLLAGATIAVAVLLVAMTLDRFVLVTVAAVSSEGLHEAHRDLRTEEQLRVDAERARGRADLELAFARAEQAALAEAAAEARQAAALAGARYREVVALEKELRIELDACGQPAREAERLRRELDLRGQDRDWTGRP